MTSNSKFSNIIATTTLLPHLTSSNINKLKQCIFEQLGCENEVDFICKSLNTLYKTMSVESTSIIKNKAIEIGDSQVLNNSNTSSITICNYIQQQYNDRLSKLHSDIIDYFGAFLSKKESIEFGYLNKQLYIETQKESYLLQRCKDEFYLNDIKLSRLMGINSNAFGYYFPSKLVLEIREHQRECVSNFVDFNNFFRRLKGLHCCNLFSLLCVPIATVFKCNNNLFADQESKDKIEELTIQAGLYDNKPGKNVKKFESFTSKFNEYKKNHNEMRQIDLLTLKPNERFMKYNKHILMACACICKRIYIIHATVVINTFHEISSIFNPNVEALYLGEDAEMIFDVDENINVEDCKDFCILKTLGCGFWGSSATLGRNRYSYNTITELDRFSMRRVVRHYVLEWKPFWSFGDSSVLYESIDVFDQFLKDNYSDKHPLLETVLIKLRDRCDLCGFARLLIYLNENYETLFVQKLGLKNFQSIEIQFEKLHWDGKNGERPSIQNCMPHPRQPETNHKNELIFAQKRTKKYSIETKEIKISNVQKGIKYFGTIYQNVVYWLKRIQENCDEYESLPGPIQGCKVAFVI